MNSEELLTPESTPLVSKFHDAGIVMQALKWIEQYEMTWHCMQ